jgi:predicted GIY-YIG superfamily endonuclease
MPRAVRTVDPLSVGSGARVQELFKLPRWFAVTVILCRGVFRHYILTLSIIVGFYLWFQWAILFELGSLEIVWSLVLAIFSVIFIWMATIGTYWVILGGRWQTAWWYWQLRRKWRHAVTNVGLKSRDGHSVPMFDRVRPVKGGLKMRVNMAKAGRGVNDLRAEADDLAEVIGAQRNMVHALKPGKAVYVLLWTPEPTFAVSTLETMSDKAKEEIEGDHTKIVFGKTAVGDAVLSLLLSVFIGGLSNSGKSNIVRAIFHALIRQKIPHELYVADPAGGVELSELEHYPHTLAYVDMPNKVEDLIKKAHKDMFSRKAALNATPGVNKITVSYENPLRIILIDELLLLGEQIKKVPDSELSQIIAVGRKFGYVVIALSQLTQVDATGRIRDLFPQKICLATENADMTDACLGKGAEANGAKCSEISLDQPGVGYYKNTVGKGFTRFRAAEAQGSLLNAGGEAAPTPSYDATRRCAVYKYYNIAGKALYFGNAYDPEERAKQHAGSKLWYSHIDHTRTKIEWYANKKEAEAAETEAIKAEHPIHNVKGRVLEDEVV